LLPGLPGVYQFLDEAGRIIYVGKAKNLKKRVSSYFKPGPHAYPKVGVMVKKIADIRHTVVESESEAFLLENNMIKNHQPRYNSMLKDDKTYPWIAIRSEHFPRVVSTRRRERDGSRYFGPYASAFVQKQVLDLLRSLYTLRICKLNLSPEAIARGKYKVCLEYHIGNCKGPCQGRQTEVEYDEGIALAVELLKGDTKATMGFLWKKMEEVAGAMRFEEAARYKRKIEVLSAYENRSVVVSGSVTNTDVVSLMIDDGTGYCNYMKIVNGAVVGSFNLEVKPGVEDSPADVLTYAVSMIAERVEGGLSREILVSFMPAEQVFKDKTFTVPKRGDKLRLLELSEKNARIYRLEKLKQIEIKDPARHTERIMETMRKALHMEIAPRHIECFDNSNLQGTNAVAACVVFRDGKPSRKEYRHFNIKTVEGPDDYASMREIIGRRYSRLLTEGGDLPQLIVIDGGKGQLRAAYEILQELGLADKITVVGLAKRIEEVFFPNDPTPYYLDRNSESLKVLMHIRDEAHRFGITFHRKKRSMAFIKSELESIPGLGPRSVEKLLKRFRTISGIKKATEEELAAVVGRQRAGEVVKYFAGNRASD